MKMEANIEKEEKMKNGPKAESRAQSQLLSFIYLYNYLICLY